MDLKMSIECHCNGADYVAVPETNGCAGCDASSDMCDKEWNNCTETAIIWKLKEQMQQKPTQQDSIVADLRELLLQRSETGISKYGTTLDRTDLKPSEWCQHLLEELLDASGYVLRLKKDLEQIEKLCK